MKRTRVLIAGGGIAAVEAMLALDDLAGSRVDVAVLSPNEQFLHRPQLVAEPFGLGDATRIDLKALAREREVAHRRAALASVDPVRHLVRTHEGESLRYEALVIAIGARPVVRVRGALTFAKRPERDAFRRLLDDLEGGSESRLVFAVPGGVHWTLPAYELALLTVARLRGRGTGRVRVALATPERQPFESFGPSAPGIVRELLGEAGIELHAGSAPVAFRHGSLELDDGRALPADRVVALPGLEVPAIAGVPQRGGGFIPTDARLNVEGLGDVWAAGDATWFPIKQGGLATQQADVAAATIASRAGAHAPVQTFRPVLRAALLTGALPLYFRKAIWEGGEAAVARSALWLPPAKLSGRYLSPYLAGIGRSGVFAGSFADLSSEEGPDADTREAELRGAFDFALAAADADARARDYRGALEWLAVVEELGLGLPFAAAERRAAWRAALGRARD